MGFTGYLVTGVWIGNDDFRPTAGVTGGSLPAQIWQSYMSVAHPDMDIPTIPGLSPHPRQVEERARLAELKRIDPGLSGPKKSDAEKTMPPMMREVLKRIAEAFRKSGGRDKIEPAEPPGRRASAQPMPTKPTP